MRHLVLTMPSGAALFAPLPHSQSAIPAELRALAAAAPSRLTIMIEESDLWAVCGTNAVGANLKLFEPFTVTFMKRAKGPGFVAIHAKPKGADAPYFTLLDFGAYSTSAVEAAMSFAACIEDLLGYTPGQQYWGADC